MQGEFLALRPEDAVGLDESGERERAVAGEIDRESQLELEVVHLMEVVERYRCAAEDTLQQLDWCIGYFAGTKNGKVAQALSANRAHIRRQYLKRAEHTTPGAEGT